MVGTNMLLLFIFDRFGCLSKEKEFRRLKSGTALKCENQTELQTLEQNVSQRSLSTH